jgi:hypothetical protein
LIQTSFEIVIGIEIGIETTGAGAAVISRFCDPDPDPDPDPDLGNVIPIPILISKTD